ncbi:MAG: dihydrofolate reductase family protein, partial [Actinomycetes bacterium]
MAEVKCSIAVSADGFVTGEPQSREAPFGHAGERLHEWMFADPVDPLDAPIIDEIVDGFGAFVMGRRMFDSGSGPWDTSWTGFWGDDPPYHGPVFVLTHHERDPLPMEGGTTFTFVTDGIESALEQAQEAAGGKDVSVTGGADTVNQFLAAGLLDELHL